MTARTEEPLTEEDAEGLIRRWKLEGKSLKIHEYLGWSEREYERFLISRIVPSYRRCPGCHHESPIRTDPHFIWLAACRNEACQIATFTGLGIIKN